MNQREFRPGFRLSALDAVVLLAGIVNAALLWRQLQWLGFVILFVVCHFFLFCNVFRISRKPELIWAGIFTALVIGTVRFGWPGWTTTTVASLAATACLAGLEMRKPSYHGIAWRRLNPRLRAWWNAQ